MSATKKLKVRFLAEIVRTLAIFKDDPEEAEAYLQLLAKAYEKNIYPKKEVASND